MTPKTGSQSKAFVPAHEDLSVLEALVILFPWNRAHPPYIVLVLWKYHSMYCGIITAFIMISKLAFQCFRRILSLVPGYISLLL